ncbi:hypothetical protein IFR05_006865 [Cadophora sp. M221]|nr:hypothetical protein IFR05_006865 [Cadophora sp. M221]
MARRVAVTKIVAFALLAASKGHEKNKLLVLHFLQQSPNPWFLIFDNIESKTLLVSSLPSCGTGLILITCRSEIFTASVADTQTETPALTDQEVSTLMLKELGIASPSSEEIELTKEFSKELGDLPLAIEMMSKYMRTRKKSVARFLPYYRENRRNPRGGIVNIYYDGDLESLWSIVFGQLDENATKVFRVLCMLPPDRIPSKILTHASVMCDSEEPADKPLADDERYNRQSRRFVPVANKSQLNDALRPPPSSA